MFTKGFTRSVIKIREQITLRTGAYTTLVKKATDLKINLNLSKNAFAINRNYNSRKLFTKCL